MLACVGFVNVRAGALRGQKVHDPDELELQAAVSHLM